MKKLFGLGRGLQSLIPSQPLKKQTQIKTDNVYNVEVNRIRPNPNQPRSDFDPDALKELAGSIKKYGILQPLLVSKIETETDKGLEVEYELIAGERRLRAAKIAGLPHVPVIIKEDMDENRAKLEVAMIENLQRKDLNPIEEAEAYLRLHQEFGMRHDAIADRVGKARETVTNSIRLLSLEPNIKEALRIGKLMRTQARSLLAIAESASRQELFKQFMAGRVTVRDAEASARMINGPRHKAYDSIHNTRYKQLQDNLSKNLKAPVFIKAREEGGKIEIRFASHEELNAIAKIILD